MMSSDTNKRPKEKAVSTNQAQKQKLEQSEAEAKTIVKAKPDSEKIQTTAFVKKSVLKKPKRPSAFKEQGNLMGLYIYTLLKRFPDCKLGTRAIQDAIFYAVDRGDDTRDVDEEGESSRNLMRVCDKLNDVFAEPMGQSVISKLIKSECGGEIKKEKSQGKNLYYFRDLKSPKHEYEVNQGIVKKMVLDKLEKMMDENY